MLICPRTLVYKITHRGDPDQFGLFGAQDCMGQIRNRSFEAVIGIGAKSAWNGDVDLVGRIVWIGIGPSKTLARGFRGPVVAFQHFVRFDAQPCNGPILRVHAPLLFQRLFESRARHMMSDSQSEPIQAEVRMVLQLARRERQNQSLHSRTVRAVKRKRCVSTACIAC